MDRKLLKTVQTITTFRNPLADPVGTRRGPPLVRGPQFENRWHTAHRQPVIPSRYLQAQLVTLSTKSYCARCFSRRCSVENSHEKQLLASAKNFASVSHSHAMRRHH